MQPPCYYRLLDAFGCDEDGAWDIKTCNQARSTYALLERFLDEQHDVFTFADFKQRHLTQFDELLLVVYRHYGQSLKPRDGTTAALREFRVDMPRESRARCHYPQPALEALSTAEHKLASVAAQKLATAGMTDMPRAPIG